MHPFRQPLVAVAAALSLVACGPQESASPAAPAAVEDGRGPARAEAARTPYELDAAFARAAAEFGVPADVLKAIAHAETRFEMIQGEVEFEGMPAASGLMALRGEKLVEGARLAGVSEQEARTQPEANIRAAAALLARYGRELGVKGEVGEWAPAVVKLSGIDNPEAQAQYVHQYVYGVLRSGVVAQTPEGGVAVSLMPNPQAQARFASPSVHALAAGPDYANSIWRASPNYNARPGGVKMIVIHTCEGSYSSCWSWLVNKSSGVSAHYVVNESGSEISQLVRESDRGWHVGATYDKSLNGNALPEVNGTSVNNFAVGIEHGGSASQTSFPSGQISASAKLSCDISKAHGIERDSYHIVAHGKLQPSSRTDPGKNWPWSSYLSQINSACGSGGGGGTTGLIIDSNNVNNDTSKGYIDVSGNWTSSTNVAGYYGSGYWAAPTAAVSDAAEFYFYMASSGTRTIDAWWTSATDRSATAPFIAYNAAGTEVGRVSKNQQSGGGSWQTLGTWSFTAGWNRVVLSRWTTTGYSVIADAVRVR